MTDFSLTASQITTGQRKLPVTIGAMTLSRVDPGSLTSVAPFKGQVAAVSRALEKAIGLPLPDTGRVTSNADTTVQWFGRDLWLLAGQVVPDLPGAAVTDQTDAWATLQLAGPDLTAVMARLVPLDLRDATFPTGAAARTDLQGMNVAIARTGPEVLSIMGFRSMAGTLSDKITSAMQTIAAL